VGQARAAREYLQGKVNVLPDESVLMGDSDFTALATKIAYLNPDAVFMALSDAGTANLIMQSKQAGAKPTTVFVGTTGPASPNFLKIGGRAVESSYMVSDAFPEARSDPLSKNFVATYQKKYNEPWNQWAAIGYTIVRIIANGISTAKPPLTRESLNNAIVATKNLPTLLGNTPFGFDQDREPTFSPIVLTIKDQKFQVAP
jgi:branched-chain amino acid transport system substrate-binding protein